MNPYQILGISPHASLAQIKSAYRQAAAINHPDRGGTHAAMVAINDAYDRLTHHLAPNNPHFNQSAPPPTSLSDWFVVYQGLLSIVERRGYKHGWITYRLIELQPPLEIWELHGQVMGYRAGFARYHWEKQ
ncbi:J domain-containing protein [Chamaesiphon minutus]|uniref:DnaJ-class molecular chaperone with C-terminal Zn finger domain n=1 Tax=Chamaesiphon minutus (strain ATCC 27169 / PCC 6605) TaxID=1173020 RepID=K9UH12_CHAP6|nr:J domain-containing protein [Chamaesiphon minutus]AFY94392.1 DnaJ-class molecular chaperone with C-terminal Zn finger domain [Chamaesiphon minutus PCC 6605]